MTETSTPRPSRLWLKVAMTLLTLAVAGTALWFLVGRELSKEYQRWREAAQNAEDNVPIGYLGLNYRRTYNDRPRDFFENRDGRLLLFASRPEPGAPAEFYDVTEASIDLKVVEGGFGRDSIPGIDYPILETSAGDRGQNLRGRQPIFGVELSDGPRAYPRDLLEKIEMVNDRDGETPILVVFDRAQGAARAFRREGATFGTTGYSRLKSPVLYDRPSRSLWTFEGGEFVCVNGSAKGRKLEPHHPLSATSWGDWLSRFPKTSVVVGNDRGKPIPTE